MLGQFAFLFCSLTAASAGPIGPEELMGRLTNVLENRGPELVVARTAQYRLFFLFCPHAHARVRWAPVRWP
jgi:hypothetical protein